MKRKTNLFYNSGQDSNFLTFSNYTEALTGNIIATNAKMFPAKFICVYVPELDKEYVEQQQQTIRAQNIIIEQINEEIREYNEAHPNEEEQKPEYEYIDDPWNYYNYDDEKSTFIDSYLVDYYENKLATLRDFISSQNDKKVENFLNPLVYLLKAIHMYSKDAKITHVGYISEQEYNGTFMDNICIIESSAKVKEYSINDVENVDTLVYENDSQNSSCLHGWENYYSSVINIVTPGSNGSNTDESAIEETIISDGQPTEDESQNFIKNHSARYDISEKKYTAKVDIKLDEIQNDSQNKIEFNLIIPLFNVYNWSQNSQNSHYYELPTNEVDPITGVVLNDYVDASGLILDSGLTNNHYDIPMGIWISDKAVSLDRKSDSHGNYVPSWSLCISSQFKPFPYSNIQTEIDSSSNTDVYGTFAMIMSKQGYILNEFNSMSYTLASLSSRLDYVTTKLNSLVVPTGNESNGSSEPSSDIYGVEIEEIRETLDRFGVQLKATTDYAYVISDNLKNYAAASTVTQLTSQVSTAWSYASEAKNKAQSALDSAVSASQIANNAKESVDIFGDAANEAITYAHWSYERTTSLGSGHFMQNEFNVAWDNTSGLYHSGTDLYISIPDIIYSYNEKYKALSYRLSEWDGEDYPASSQKLYYLQAIASTFGNIEKNFEDIRNILIDAANNGGTINPALSGHNITEANWSDTSNNSYIGSWISKGGNNENNVNPE